MYSMYYLCIVFYNTGITTNKTKKQAGLLTHQTSSFVSLQSRSPGRTSVQSRGSECCQSPLSCQTVTTGIQTVTKRIQMVTKQIQTVTKQIQTVTKQIQTITKQIQTDTNSH